MILLIPPRCGNTGFWIDCIVPAVSWQFLNVQRDTSPTHRAIFLSFTSSSFSCMVGR